MFNLKIIKVHLWWVISIIVMSIFYLYSVLRQTGHPQNNLFAVIRLNIFRVGQYKVDIFFIEMGSF